MSPKVLGPIFAGLFASFFIVFFVYFGGGLSGPTFGRSPGDFGRNMMLWGDPCRAKGRTKGTLLASTLAPLSAFLGAGVPNRPQNAPPNHQKNRIRERMLKWSPNRAQMEPKREQNGLQKAPKMDPSGRMWANLGVSAHICAHPRPCGQRAQRARSARKRVKDHVAVSAFAAKAACCTASQPTRTKLPPLLCTASPPARSPKCAFRPHLRAKGLTRHVATDMLDCPLVR